MKKILPLLFAIASLTACKKQEEGILRVESSDLSNQTGNVSMWVCQIKNNNRTDYLDIDTVAGKLTAQTETFQGETWEVYLSGGNLSSVVSVNVYLEGDIIGYANTAENGTVSYRITIE